MSDINGWSVNIERLLSNWSQQISINENEYRKRGTYYRYWYYGFGMVILLIHTSILSTLLNTLVRQDGNSNIIIVITILETIVFLANGIDKFFNFASDSAKFYEAAKEHNALSRLIDSSLAFSRTERDNARDVLLSIRQQFNQIKDNSPDLPPNNIIHKLEMCIYENPREARGNKGTGVILVGAEHKFSVKTPHNKKNISLPESPPRDDEVLAHNEETINNAHRHKFKAQLQVQKKVAAKEHQSHGVLKNLEYQWRRMEQHAEEDSKPQGDDAV